MEADYLAEMVHGEGAVSTVGKLIIRGNRFVDGELKGTVLAGAVVPALIDYKDGGKDEMWEVQVILIPQRKFKLEKKGSFEGYRIDQMLTSNFQESDNWADAPYWEKEE